MKLKLGSLMLVMLLGAVIYLSNTKKTDDGLLLLHDTLINRVVALKRENNLLRDTIMVVIPKK